MTTSTTATDIARTRKQAILQELSLGQWEVFVRSQISMTTLHHRFWLELLMEQYGFRPKILGLADAQGIRAAVPFLEITRPWGTRHLVSLPFTDCVPVRGNSPDDVELLRVLLQSYPFAEYKTVVIRNDRQWTTFPIEHGVVRHLLDLTRSIDEIQASFKSALRRNLRHAEAAGLRFERNDDAESMDAFYRLHLLTRRKLGVPVQPKNFFRRFHHWIIANGLGFIGVVKNKRDDVVAAGIFLTYGDTTIYKYGASDPQALADRPNEFMMLGAIREAVVDGKTRFDFGTSRLRDVGLRRFKRKWGAKEVARPSEYLVGRISDSDHDSPVMRLASTVIRHSPTWVCRTLGEFFYRFSK